MVAGLGVDIRPLIQAAVEAGGHVRVGLEDAPLGTGITNVEWVREAASLIRAAGGGSRARRRCVPPRGLVALPEAAHARGAATASASTCSTA